MVSVLQPTIDPYKVAETKQKIIDHFREQTKGPLQFVSAFNEHEFLFNGEVKNCINTIIY